MNKKQKKRGENRHHTYLRSLEAMNLRIAQKIALIVKAIVIRIRILTIARAAAPQQIAESRVRIAPPVDNAPAVLAAEDNGDG
jgi:hypothetical protein